MSMFAVTLIKPFRYEGETEINSPGTRMFVQEPEARSLIAAGVAAPLWREESVDVAVLRRAGGLVGHYRAVMRTATSAGDTAPAASAESGGRSRALERTPEQEMRFRAWRAGLPG